MINYFITATCWRGLFLMNLFFLEEVLIISKTLKIRNSFHSLSFIETRIPIREHLQRFHDQYLISWLFGILTLVAILILRFYFSNFTSKKFVANFRVELGWIIFPSFILLAIGMPSIDFLYKLEEGEKENLLSFKRFGYQWFWTYESSNSLEDETILEERYMSSERREDNLNYISSDVSLNIPNFSSILNIISARDVLHRWALPSIIIKADAIPGRLNSLSFEFNSLNEEKHYGQCSELCGANHRFIPVVVRVYNRL